MPCIKISSTGLTMFFYRLPIENAANRSLKDSTLRASPYLHVGFVRHDGVERFSVMLQAEPVHEQADHFDDPGFYFHLGLSTTAK